MIIAQIKGGLGNQLFQYAMGLAVAHRNGTHLRLDLSEYEFGPSAPLRSRIRRDIQRHPLIPVRRYVLPRWNVQAEPATRYQVARIRMADRIVGALRPGTPYYARPIVRERPAGVGFDPNTLEAPDPSLLVGFWQTERYFAEIEPEIRRQFTLREDLSGPSQQVARAIQNCNSVFVHFRRGDYLQHQRCDQTKSFEVCTPAYYQNAIARISAQLRQPHLFVFSDEPAWVRQNWKIDLPFTVVDHNPSGDHQTVGREHEDLWLMSLCRHAIIANSSFSWWGAWLSPVRDRIVIAPTVWFRDPIRESSLFVPERWTRIRLD